MKSIKKIITASLLSILVFLSISFITVLLRMAPFHYYKNGEGIKFTIGFPFKYYTVFFANGNSTPNWGWATSYLVYDCLLTWAVVMVVYLTMMKKRKG